MSITNLSFNNINTHLTCCTDKCYIVYSLLPILEKKIYYDMDNLKLMKIYNRTNISLLVGGENRSNNMLVLWDESNKRCLMEINVKQPIINALIEKERIIAILEESIVIFDWMGNCLYTKETIKNPSGLGVINNSSILATVGIQPGEIALYDILNNKYKMINAHKSNIVALALNKESTMVATASTTGTIIRIFEINTGELLYELRRGTSTATIYSLSFNHDSTRLVCTSSNGTVHIFNLHKDNNKDNKNTESILSSFKNYLPSYFGSQWSYKPISINTNVKTISTFDDSNNLHIVSYDGKYYNISGVNYVLVTEGQLYPDNK